MGNPLLRRSQLGVEDITDGYGVPVAATRQLHGFARMDNNPDRVLREEARASMGGSNTYDDLARSSTGTYTGRCTTSELPYWISNAVCNATPTSPDGSGEPYLWAHKQPLTKAEKDAAVLKPFTLFTGDEDAVFRTPGVMVKTLTIAGQDKGEWSMNADLMGCWSSEVDDADAPITFDTGLSTPANETMINKLGRIYMDDAGGTIGTTALATTAYGFRWVYATGYVFDDTMDADLDPNGILRGLAGATLEITAKLNATTKAKYTKWRTLANQLVRVANVGSIISGAYHHQLWLDGAYVFTGFQAQGEEREGTTVCTMTLAAVEDTTWTNKIRVTHQGTVAGSALTPA